MNTSNGTLHIPNPCPFLLQRMGKTGTDFHCGSCNKTIIDLRYKSADEIACYAGTGACVIMHADQLPGQQQKSFFYRMAFASLMVLSFIGFNVKPVSAQQTNDTLKNKLRLNHLERSDLTHEISSDSTHIEQPSAEVKKEATNRKKYFRRKKHWIGCPEF